MEKYIKHVMNGTEQNGMECKISLTAIAILLDAMDKTNLHVSSGIKEASEKGRGRVRVSKSTQILSTSEIIRSTVALPLDIFIVYFACIKKRKLRYSHIFSPFLLS